MAARRGEKAEQALAKATTKAAAKAEARPARDAKALAKANAKTKAEAQAKAKADDDFAALAKCLAKNQAHLAAIKALGAGRAYTGTICRTAAAGRPRRRVCRPDAPARATPRGRALLGESDKDSTAPSHTAVPAPPIGATTSRAALPRFLARTAFQWA